MVENPQSWGKAERVVAEALRQAEEGHRQGMVGWSTVRQITHALEVAGLLKKEEDK